MSFHIFLYRRPGTLTSDLQFVWRALLTQQLFLPKVIAGKSSATPRCKDWTFPPSHPLHAQYAIEGEKKNGERFVKVVGEYWQTPSISRMQLIVVIQPRGCRPRRTAATLRTAVRAAATSEPLPVIDTTTAATSLLQHRLRAASHISKWTRLNQWTATLSWQQRKPTVFFCVFSVINLSGSDVEKGDVARMKFHKDANSCKWIIASGSGKCIRSRESATNRKWV